MLTGLPPHINYDSVGDSYESAFESIGIVQDKKDFIAELRDIYDLKDMSDDEILDEYFGAFEPINVAGRTIYYFSYIHY
jgi:hypothetical protein